MSEITTLLLKISVLRKITTLFRNSHSLVRNPLICCQKSTFSARNPCFPVINHRSPVENPCSPVRDPCFLSEFILFLWEITASGSSFSLQVLQNCLSHVDIGSFPVTSLLLAVCACLLHLLKLSAGVRSSLGQWAQHWGTHSLMCLLGDYRQAVSCLLDFFLISLLGMIISSLCRLHKIISFRYMTAQTFKSCYLV